MNDNDLENLIRSLKPSPLPGDLKARMSAEPMRPKVTGARRQLFIAAAAAVLVGVITVTTFMRPDRPAETVSSDLESPVSVIKKDSTLLNSRTLAIKEHNGQLWEVSEEEWQDDTLALCSVGPTKLNSTVIRREVVCSPVEFQ